jgi:hypothetical protein
MCVRLQSRFLCVFCRESMQEPRFLINVATVGRAYKTRHTKRKFVRHRRQEFDSVAFGFDVFTLV